MKKKILSVVLAMTMVLGMSISSFAGTLEGDAAVAGQDVTGTSTVTVPTISVTVPTTTAIVINPFQLTATLGEGTTTEQVISAKQEITSASNVDLLVNVENFKVTVPELASNAPAGKKPIAVMSATAAKATAKSIYLYMLIGADVSATDAKTVKADAKGVTTKAVATLAKGGTADAPKKVEFVIKGDVNANPTYTDSTTKAVVADPWTTTDTVSVAFKFTFTPQINTASNGG